MKKLIFSFQTELSFSSPVTSHNFILRCLPVDNDVQTITKQNIEIFPNCKLLEQKDGFGNRILCGSLLDKHSSLSYSVSGEALVDHSKQKPCQAHPMYKYPGKLTAPNTSLKTFLQSIPLSRTDAIQDSIKIGKAVYGHFLYAPGSTNVSFSASDSFSAASGVCQDYAHVMIVLCRLSGIPARYCAGLTIGEGSTHAWVEIYANGRWIGIDPTRNTMVDDSYLTLAVGRDFADCAIERGLFLGNADQVQSVFAHTAEQ